MPPSRRGLTATALRTRQARSPAPRRATRGSRSATRTIPRRLPRNASGRRFRRSERRSSRRTRRRRLRGKPPPPRRPPPRPPPRNERSESVTRRSRFHGCNGTLAVELSLVLSYVRVRCRRSVRGLSFHGAAQRVGRTGWVTVSFSSLTTKGKRNDAIT